MKIVSAEAVDHCPPELFTAVYPILKNVPADCQEAIVRQAERGEPLTDEQAAMLGLPLLAGSYLVPSYPGYPWTDAQLSRAFPPEQRKALFDSIAQCVREELAS